MSLPLDPHSPPATASPSSASARSAARGRRRQLWALGGLVAALAGGGAAVLGLSSPSAEANAPAAPPPATPVSVAPALQRSVAAWHEFSGRLEAVERVDIRPRVAGTVQAVHFREGALVKAGELLVTLDPAPYAAEVERLDAQVAAAQARVSHAASELQRSQRLWQERAIAQRELDERENAAREAEANLRSARAALQAARLNLGYTQVRAPVAGRVGRLEVTVGNLVAAGASAPVLTTLVSVSPIYASFEADEQVVLRALRQLPGGGSARSQLARIPVRMGTAESADLPHAGQLQLVDNQVDARSGTVRVRAVFDNADGSLMPGQFARLRMGQPSEQPAVLISERAIGTDQSKKFVLVVGADNTASYREVTLGPSIDGLRVVASGLKAGERIVVNGLQRVRPGAQVAPQPVEMDARAQQQAGGRGATRS
ncbi:efflux RND transporter periplasmic adaptor subunit [Aquabacterium sp. A7-Y]|uniref:efflux RND transporter periplasmic adaptor subunit n=1 Tax=Aquabacterium sp. A7-Y TaxID=1349605 RepID=UPI00223DF995|nr:efflux RND transporter periplasmic adaptor subunit [Aquabacterium sp. A7-Y]MCW7537130.1 efflux RND transporter periplasmic adaptor subunit [Aquabacterium sp. A7-Y]